MKYLKIVIGAGFLLSLSVGVASAQKLKDSDKYHPFLSSTFQIGLGVFAPTQTNKIGADLDFLGGTYQGSLDSTESQTTGILDFRWRFTDNWSFHANYWKTSSGTRDTLTEDFPFRENDTGDEIVFQKGSFIGYGFDASVARLFLGRSFYKKPGTDWGVGLGLHLMQIDAYVEGEAVLGAGDVTAGTDYQEGSRSFGAPMPNLGIWYMHSWSPKWVFISRLDWSDVSFKDISGRMIDASIGVNYQISDHFGAGLAFKAFDLDVDIDWLDEFSTNLATLQYGPRLNLTWNW
jgi:hypothetical protein